MNPLLPELPNNPGRNVSFGAKPGAKRDSEDSTRFHDTLQANTPERKKNTTSNTSDNATSRPAKGTASENSSQKNAARSPAKQPVSESGSHPQNTKSDSDIEVDSSSPPTDGQLIVAEPAAINAGDSLTEGGAPVFTAVSENIGQTTTAPSILEAGQAAELPSGLEQLVSGVSNAEIQVANSGSTVSTSALSTSGGAAVIAGTGLASEISAGTTIGPGVAGTVNADAASASGKLSPSVTQVESEKPFATLNADLTLTDAFVDKKNLTGKPGNSIPFSPQPGAIKLNLDGQFANGMSVLEADAALDITSASKSPSSVTGTAYAAVSTVAAMQINGAVADQHIQMPVNIKFGQPEWAGMVAERTAMMAAQKITFAELQLDPPELGPMHVKVTVQNDQASVNFVSASPAVRDSLEQTAVRLREMLDQQGLNLVDVNVADQSDRQQQHPDDSQPNSHKPVNAEEDAPTGGSVNLMTVVASGIDHYV